MGKVAQTSSGTIVFPTFWVDSIFQESLDGRISKLEQTLDRVGSTEQSLRDLLEKERQWRERLVSHSPPRVLPGEVERQIEEFSVSWCSVCVLGVV